LLKESIKKKIFFVLCCRLYRNAANISKDSIDKEQVVHIPSSMELQRELMMELKRSKTSQKMLTDFISSNTTTNNTTTGGFMNTSRVNGGGIGSPKLKNNLYDFQNMDTNSLYVLPPNACDNAIAVDFISICINPPIEISLFEEENNNKRGATSTTSSGYRFLESQLELHLMPTNLVDNTVSILNKFEQQAANEVKAYMDKLLEEVDEPQAAALRAAELDVVAREASLKMMRDDVEKERKGQEVMLKELKLQQQGDEVFTSAMQHSNSNAHVVKKNNRR